MTLQDYFINFTQNSTSLFIDTVLESIDSNRNDVLHVGNERILIESVCFRPVRIFTQRALEVAITCWEWLLTARKDLEDEVNLNIFLKVQFAVWKVCNACKLP